MQMVNLTIDGKQIQAPAGSSVLEAARSAGIYIPTLCYHPDLRPEGACRLCMVEASGADMIDFNMGCPVPKIVNNGEGSALMKNPQLAHDILAAMVKAVKIPVTVKFRAGWDDANRNAVEIARAVEAAGVSAVAVHGRTRQQFYEGKADWSIIADVKQAVKVPVFGNGDIFTVADGLRMLEQTGCDLSLIHISEPTRP